MLPTTGVSALLAASLAHLSTMKSVDDDARDAAAYRFCQTMQILQHLQKVYDSADSTVAFLAITLRKSGLDRQTAWKELQGTDVLSFSAMQRPKVSSWQGKQHHSSLSQDPEPVHRTISGSVLTNPDYSTQADGNELPSLFKTPMTTSDDAAGCMIPSLVVLPTRTSSPGRSHQPDAMVEDIFSPWANNDCAMNINDTSVQEMMNLFDTNFDYDADNLLHSWGEAESCAKVEDGGADMLDAA